MVRYNYISSCLLFLTVLGLSVSNSYGNEGDDVSSVVLNGNDDVKVWDMDYGLTIPNAKLSIDINRFWVKVFVTVHDGLRKVKVAAALSKDGLYMYPGFAIRLPRQGTLELGPSQIEYSMKVPSIDTPKCSHYTPNPISIEGLVPYFVTTKHDTWVKDEYWCFLKSQEFPASSFICSAIQDKTYFRDSFSCDTAIMNLTDNSMIPIWNSEECHFAPPCILDGYLAQLLDASKIEKCFQGSFSEDKECQTVAR